MCVMFEWVASGRGVYCLSLISILTEPSQLLCSTLQSLYRQVCEEKAVLEKEVVTMKRTATPRYKWSTSVVGAGLC